MRAPFTLEFGLNTFGDVTLDGTGKPLHHAEVLRNVVREAELALERCAFGGGVGRFMAVSEPIGFACRRGGGGELVEEAVDAADHGSRCVFAWRERFRARQGIGSRGSHGQDAEENGESQLHDRQPRPGMP